MSISKEAFAMRLLQDVSDAIIASDTEHRIMEWNPAAERLYGYSRQDVLGRTVTEVTQREYIGISRKEVLALFERDGFWSGDVRERHRDGRMILVHTRVSKVHSPAGAFIGLVAVNRDITIQRQEQEERIQKSRLELMGFILSSVSHSLNNHLTAILGSLSVARRYAGAQDKIVGYLDKADSASMSIRNLMQQLMIVAGNIHPVFQSVNLSSILSKAMQPYAQYPGVRFNVPGFPNGIVLWGNPKHLLQVFRHVFDNAVEAMGGEGEVTVAIDTVDGIVPGADYRATGAIIRITDSGPGVPVELQSRIFDPFHTTRENRSGLGLAVSRAIIRQHGGSISMETAESGSACLVINLPIPDPSKLSGTSPVSVLIFESDDLLCQVWCDLIRQIGFGATGVTTRKEGLNALRRNLTGGHPYSLVIVDLDNMCSDIDTDGGEAIRLPEPVPPVLAVSSHAAHALRIDCGMHGYAGWLDKPVTLETLENEVNRILGL